MKALVAIPARLASTRLPDKPLADIGGLPMIVQVWRRAMEADVGPVIVACGDPEIATAVQDHGGQAIMTDPDLPSGSDRIHAAVQEFDPAGDHDHIVNLQGDLPALDPAVVRTALEPLRAEGVDIATLVAEIQDPAEITDPNAVKAIVAFAPGQSVARALYFTRAAAPHGDGPYWHHIGIYAYRRAALARFVALQPSLLEQRERLEQLRALENHMRIDAARVDAVPLGVDTPEDLEKVRQQFADGAFASFTGTGFMGRG